MARKTGAMARNAGTKRHRAKSIPNGNGGPHDDQIMRQTHGHFQNNHNEPATPTISKIDARPMLEAHESGYRRSKLSKRTKSFLWISGFFQTSLPIWVQTCVMIGLIFGGCCSNVFALEAIVKKEPQSGLLITLAQFLLVSIEGAVHFFDSKSPTFFKPNQIPLYRWLGAIVLFFSVSMLNNFAFGYNISVPVHIILRSAGPVTTMVIGFCFGKRYSTIQILSVVILTCGVVTAAMGDAKGNGSNESDMTRLITGLSVLFLAQILSAFMGVYIEQTYQQYGNNWREGLFYTHALSLPLFIPFMPNIMQQFNKLASSPAVSLTEYLTFLPEQMGTIKAPAQLLNLAANALTQYVCVRGVNLLGGISSALTVTIVLNIRKLVSLLLSIYLFGNTLSGTVMLGATIVFAGGFLYGLESQRQGKRRKRQAMLAKRVGAKAQ